MAGLDGGQRGWTDSLEKRSTGPLLLSRGVGMLEARSRVSRMGGGWCTRGNTGGIEY